jgi:hypothetical protein
MIRQRLSYRPELLGYGNGSRIKVRHPNIR